jgi:hypothetical protein
MCRSPVEPNPMGLCSLARSCEDQNLAELDHTRQTGTVWTGADLDPATLGRGVLFQPGSGRAQALFPVCSYGSSKLF